MFDHQLLAFSGLALLLTIAPGADTILVIRSVLSRGARAGIVTTLGICSGLFVHATASALGLSLFLTRSATAFHVVKTAGALYLAYLGLRSLWDAWTDRGEDLAASDEGAISEASARGGASAQVRGARSAHPHVHRRAFIDGLLSNVLNPKAAVFYLAVLPQFISPGDPVVGKSLLLAAIHFAMGIVWLVSVSLGVGRARAVLRRSSVRRGLEAATGLVLVGFGARLALDRG